MIQKTSAILCVFLAFTTTISAESNTTSEGLKDMSDPLAVYSRAGIGITNRGINIKFGLEYKTDDLNKKTVRTV